MNLNSLSQNFSVNFLKILIFLTCLLAFIYLVDGVANQSSLFSQNTGTSADGKTLVTSLFAFMATLSSLWSVVTARKSAEKIEELKHQNAEKIEELKQQLTTQFPALKESRSAALSYYRALSSLVEIENFDQSSLEQCEKNMLEAEGNVFFLSEQYQNNWYSYWQKVDNICAKINKENDRQEKKRKWREIWSKELAEQLRSLADYKPVSNSISRSA